MNIGHRATVLRLATVCALVVVSNCCGQEVERDGAKNLLRQIQLGEQQITLHVGPAQFTLVRIEPGEFLLGSETTDSLADANEKRSRVVRITRPFYIGKTEVTQGQFRAVMKGRHLARFIGDSLPVEGLTYAQSIAFCRSLSERTGLDLTLPTEAQWEYACRANTDTTFYSGENVDTVGWYKANSYEMTHPCGIKEPNPWGIHDMLGNVWEPCKDVLPSYEKVASTNPVGESNPNWGIMRGGGWQHGAEYCRAAVRLPTDDKFGGMGVRVVLNIDRKDTSK